MRFEVETSYHVGTCSGSSELWSDIPQEDWHRMVPVKKLGEVRERYREMADGRSVWEWKEYTLCVLLDEGEYVLILDEEGTVIGGEVPDGDYEVEEIKLEGIGREVHVYREQIEMEG